MFAADYRMTFSVVNDMEKLQRTLVGLGRFSGDKKDDREGITRMLVYNFIMEQNKVGLMK